MAKATSVYICQQCGYKSPQYLGKCPQCDSWNSMVETIEKTQNSKLKTQNLGRSERAEIVDLSQIQKTDYKRMDTGFEEFNRVLGGGIVAGSLVLVAGDPGIGKSTLLTQLALNVNSSVILNEAKRSEESLARLAPAATQGATKRANASHKPVGLAQGGQVVRSFSLDFARDQDDRGGILYVAGEESAQQIKLRVDRIKANTSLSVLNETDVDLIIEAITKVKSSLVIIDSIQTLETQDLESVAGSVGQVRESAHRLQRLAKDLHIPIFLVGHVTKEGNIAGPKTLEHVVDVVLSLEGDPSSLFRILRSTKNRFGPTEEVGIFEMEDQGMIEVKNPSKLFLDQKVHAPGSAVAAILTGARPLLIEIQALVTKTSLPIPRRTASGIDNNRLQLMVAVLQKRLGLPLFDQDIFVNVTGGLTINNEPAADLGICLAIVSSFKDQVIKQNSAMIGEVGLLGELRAVRQIDKRVTEAKKLGFVHVFSPEIKTLAQAVKSALTTKNNL